MSPSDPCSNRNFIQCHVAVVLWKIFTPLFIFIGISGNILSMTVLSRKRMRYTTTSVYLRFLAAVDSMVLLMPVLRNLIYYYTGINIREQSMFACKFHVWLSVSVSALSFWLLPVITLDRLIQIKYPIWAKRHCTRRSSIFIILALTATILIINSHIVAFQERVEVFMPSNATRTAVLKAVKCIPGTSGYKKFYNRVWPVFMFIVYTILPIVLVITSNFILVRELTKRNRQKQTRRSLQDTQERELRDLRSVTKMLIVVCVFFIVISIPTCIHMLIAPYIFDPKSRQDAAKSLLMWSVVSLVLYSNNTVNFILYCFSGRLFRKELLAMVRWAKLSVQNRINSRVVPIETTDEQPPADTKQDDDVRAGTSCLSTKITNIDTRVSEAAGKV